MNAKGADQDSANTGRDFLVGTARLPVLELSASVHRRRRLYWLITADLRQRGATLGTVLRKIFVLGAALSTKDCHNFCLQGEPENPTLRQGPPVQLTTIRV